MYTGQTWQTFRPRYKKIYSPQKPINLIQNMPSIFLILDILMDQIENTIKLIWVQEANSSGSIVSDYGPDDRAIGVRSPVGAKDFSSILCVQTGSGAYPASCTMSAGGPFPGGKSAAGA
jgi:hypothetical protein